MFAMGFQIRGELAAYRALAVAGAFNVVQRPASLHANDAVRSFSTRGTTSARALRTADAQRLSRLSARLNAGLTARRDVRLHHQIELVSYGLNSACRPRAVSMYGYRRKLTEQLAADGYFIYATARKDADLGSIA
jgi:hypothetical protein